MGVQQPPKWLHGRTSSEITFVAVSSDLPVLEVGWFLTGLSTDGSAPQLQREAHGMSCFDVQTVSTDISGMSTWDGLCDLLSAFSTK